MKALSKLSLRTRIILSVLVLTTVLVPMIAIALNKAFEQHVRQNVKDQLNAYFYSVLAVTEYEDGQLIMPEVLLDNQFNLIGSGHYALISKTQTSADAALSDTNDILWFSNSFLGATVSSPLPSPSVGHSLFGSLVLNDRPHLIFSYSVRFDVTSVDSSQNDFSPEFTVHVIKDYASIEQQQSAFSEQLWKWFITLIGVFGLTQFFWLTWTLKPLAKFSEEIHAVRSGQSEHVSTGYPSELNTVAVQLNELLQNEQRQRERYRNALSDLAHSLKTPLAVIQSQQDLSDASIEQINKINLTINHQLKRAQMAGQSAWHKGVEVQLVCTALVRALAKIYPAVSIEYLDQAHPGCMFKGDEADLTEILGNLLDNACKAAKSRVRIVIKNIDQGIECIVEDDGVGISEEQQVLIMQRGKRLDTYEKGYGIGLSIVQDLIASYQGKLMITRSNELGGAQFSITFTFI